MLSPTSASLGTGKDGHTSLVPGVGWDSVGRHLDGAEKLPSGAIEIQWQVNRLLVNTARFSDPFQDHGREWRREFGCHLDSLVARVELSAFNCQTGDDESLLVVNDLLLLFLCWIELELQLGFLKRPVVQLSSCLLRGNQECLRRKEAAKPDAASSELFVA